MNVRWHCLALEGFGKYVKIVRADFVDGLNTLVAANESGKSTLVSGLAAVIYGLSNSASRDAFSTTRFLSWGRPERFRGALLFSSGDKRYRIERQFESNSVLVEAESRAGVWQTMATGEHNPQAHKRNKNYEDAINSLIGVGSRELFERTFMVTQPLPETDALDVTVQELLSGGGTAAEKAVSILAERLREITRLNTVFGVGTSNARSDRELDLVDRRIGEAQQALREGIHLLDDLPVKHLELRNAEDRHRENEAALRKSRDAVAAWTEWRSVRNAYEAALRQMDAHQKALEHLLDVTHQAKSARTEIAHKYASFSHLAPETGEQLAELKRTEAAIADRNTKIDSLGIERLRLGTQVTEYEAQLCGSYASVTGRSDLMLRLSELRAMCQGLSEMGQAISEQETHQEALSRFRREFGDLNHLTEEFREALKTKINLLERRYKVQAQGQADTVTRRARDKRAASPAARVLASVGAGALCFAAVLNFFRAGVASGAESGATAVAVICALLGALLGWMLCRPRTSGSSPEATVTRATDEIGDAMRAIDAALGEYADLDQTQLAMLLSRLSQRDAELRHLTSATHTVGDAPGLIAEMRSARDRLALKASEMRSRVAPFDENSDPQGVQHLIDEARQIERLRERRVLERTEVQRRLESLESDQQIDMARRANLESMCRAVLEASGGNTEQAISEWRSFQQMSLALSGLERESKGVLGGLGLATEDDLRHRLADSEVRVRRALDEWEALVMRHPALPGADLQYDLEALSLRQQALQAEIERLERETANAEQDVIRLNREVQALESGQSHNISRVQEQLSMDMEHAAALRLKARSIALAHNELRAARRTFQESYRDTLAARVTQRFDQMSGVLGRKVTLDEDFHIGIVADSQVCSQRQLSQGARDQLYVAVRLAIADLLAFEAEVPFIFDDPFLTFDDERLCRMRESLQEIAARRQIVLLSHREEMATWGQRIMIKENARWPW